MTFHLELAFPSEAEELRQHSQAARRLTPTQRLLAVVDALGAAEALSRAGGVREAQLLYQQRLEEDWRRRIKEFFQQHVRP
jgi:hypothetical protein